MISRGMIAGVAGAVLAVGAGMPVASAAPAGALAASAGWRVQRYFTDCLGRMTSVTATGPGDAWAGELCTAGADTQNPVAVHWNGRWWQRVWAPGGQRYEGATAVAALSGSYAWMFTPGFSGLGGQDFALLRHGGRWKRYQLADDSAIDSAMVFSRSDAWGFGTVRHAAYAVRFNGRTWRRVPVPVVPLAAAARGPGDIWAAGPPVREAGLTVPRSYRLARWTGRWHVIALPPLSLPAGAYLGGASVLAAGPGAAFVTVQYKIADGVSADPAGGALLYWDGARWTNIKLPIPVQVLGPLARDGQGGLWVASGPMSGDPSLPDVMLHRGAAGGWSQASLPESGLHVSSMRLIPGTTSLWAGGFGFTEDAPDDNSGTPAMFRYDP